MFKRIGYDPSSSLMMFISSEEQIKINKVQEYSSYYSGDSNTILNFYTTNIFDGIPKNPIFLRNKATYFWTLSADEQVKRVHSGIPRALVDILTNIIGLPTIIANNDLDKPIIEEILNSTRFFTVVNQRQIPLTLVQGDGCFKINLKNGKIFIEYYEADKYKLFFDGETVIKARFYNNYVDKDKNYLLVENRVIENGGLHIYYELFEKVDWDTIKPVTIDTIDATANFTDIYLNGIDSLLITHSLFFDDPLNIHTGKSIYEGKVDLFDFLDEVLSQYNANIRVCTPQEYFPEDLIEHKNGVAQLPKTYRRNYVMVASSMTSDPRSNSDRIQVTQSDLNVKQFTDTIDNIIDKICVGLMSATSIGMFKNSSTNYWPAEYEKETILTRNNIIESERHILSNVINDCLKLYYYIHGMQYDESHFVEARFTDFANPSLENEIKILGQAWSQGQISTELYIKTLWKDRLTEEEQLREIERLNTIRDRMLFAPMAYERKNTDGAGIEIPDTVKEEKPKNRDFFETGD